MPFVSVVVLATTFPALSFSTTVTPAMGTSPVLLLSRSSRTLPVIVPEVATIPASQLRSDSPDCSAVCTVRPVAASASLSLVSVAAAASRVVKA